MSAGNITIKNNYVHGFYGLVICGGKSCRMGSDKSLLVYHEKPQRYHVYEMLQPFCESVFLSCNASQLNDIAPSYTALPDMPAFENSGPIAAVLTAFSLFPNRDLLIAGSDYPFLKDRDLAELLSSCNKRTTAFYNIEADLYEPLLGYYSFSDYKTLKELHALNLYSLQHFLKTINAGKLLPANVKSIRSVDTEEEYFTSKDFIDQLRS